MSKVCLRAFALVAVLIFAGVAMAGAITVAAATTTLFVNGSSPVGTDTSCSSPGYSTIQAAVTAAAQGDTIFVCSGTYSEQVKVTTADLTIEGPTSGPAAIIDPSTVACNTTDLDTAIPTAAVVLVSGVSGVTVANLTVNGSAGGSTTFTGCASSPQNFWGVVYQNASGTVSADSVVNFTPTSNFSGGNNNDAGVYVQSSTGTSSVTVTGSNVSGYQKNGITCNDAHTTCSITKDTVTGSGPIPSEAQNGIQIGFGATGAVSGNVVGGDDCTNSPSIGTASGILIIQASGVSVADNSVTDSQQAIVLQSFGGYSNTAGASMSNDTVSHNRISYDSTYASNSANATSDTAGVAVAGYNFGSAVPSVSATVTDNTVDGPGSFSQTSPVLDSTPVGLQVGDQASNAQEGNLTVTATGNLFENWVADVMNAGTTNGTDATALTDNALLSAPFGVDNISGSAIGTTAVTTSALDNWWQSASGPTSPSNPGGTGVPVSANVTFNPWLATVSMTPAAQGATLGSTATVRATLRDNTGATVSAAPLDSLFSTSPNVGAQTTALSSGSAPFSLSDSSAQTVTVHAAIGFGAQPSASTLAGSATVTFFNGSAYTALTPTRILDTRTDGKTLGPASSLNLTVTGGSVPSTATAVALNVTVTNTTAASFLTVYPTGGSNPVASSLNWTAGETIPNLVIVPVGTNGQVSFYNHSGSVDVIVDLEGYFGATNGTLAGSYVALTPARIADTRPNSGQPYAGHTLSGGSTLNIQVAGKGGIPATGASAALVNVTVTNTTAASFLTVYPAGASRPLASNLNWVAGETIANRVVVPIGSNGQITVFNHSGSVDVIVDVDGYFTASGFAPSTATLFTPVTPVRVLDTRSNGETLSAGDTLTLQLGGVAGIPSNAGAVVTNVTATDTTASSYFTIYPGGTRPLASDLNWVAGETIPNLTVATLSGSGTTTIYNHAGSADVVVDAYGYFSQG